MPHPDLVVGETRQARPLPAACLLCVGYRTFIISTIYTWVSIIVPTDLERGIHLFAQSLEVKKPLEQVLKGRSVRRQQGGTQEHALRDPGTCAALLTP